MNCSKSLQVNEFLESDNIVEGQDPVKMQPTDFNPSQISNKKKLWECQECGKFFSVKGNMKRHNKTFHKESNSNVESFSSSTDAEKHVSMCECDKCQKQWAEDEDITFYYSFC